MQDETTPIDPAIIDPSLRLIARLLPDREGRYARDLHRARTHDAVLWRLLALPRIEVVKISPTTSVRLYRPRGAPAVSPGILWIHGGGYVAGAAMMDDRLAQRAADASGALVASVEYRLAPEHPYPGALDDCSAALHWLAMRRDVDRQRIALVGVSAGGGLAASLALRCRDAGVIPLAGQVLVYPMLDDRTVQRSTPTRARGWPPEDNAFGWRSYLGCAPGSAGVSFYAAPARCPDLSGLPPAWIGVGSADLFHDENVDYANRLRDAGVPAQLDVAAGAFHGFDRVGPFTAVARRFTAARLAATCRFVAEAVS
jgi:acetyl esterase/lipase